MVKSLSPPRRVWLTIKQDQFSPVVQQREPASEALAGLRNLDHGKSRLPDELVGHVPSVHHLGTRRRYDDRGG